MTRFFNQNQNQREIFKNSLKDWIKLSGSCYLFFIQLVLLRRYTTLTSGLFLMGLFQYQVLYLVLEMVLKWSHNSKENGMEIKIKREIKSKMIIKLWGRRSEIKKYFVRHSRCLLFMFVHVCVPVCNNRPLPGLCTYSRTKRPLYKYTRSATPRVQEKAREWKSDRAREKENKKRLEDTQEYHDKCSDTPTIHVHTHTFSIIQMVTQMRDTQYYIYTTP